MLTFLCKTKNNLDVLVDLEHSHAATHFQDTPNLKENVITVLQNYIFDNDRVRFEYDLKKVVGKSALVPTSLGDEIVYAKRPNRQSLMRFVKNREPVATTYITIDLRKIDNKSCELFTAYIGNITPFYPGQSDETSESKPFWGSHALVWGIQATVPGTETTIRPW